MFDRQPSLTRLSRRECLALLGAAAGLGASGCVNVAAMTAKMLTGEPMTTPAFTVATGVDLVKSEAEIIVHVSSPSTILREHTTLTFDLEQALREKIQQHDIGCVDPNYVSNILDAKGLRFDPHFIAQKIDDVDYIFRIHLETFSLHIENSPNLLQGTARGTVSGFAVEGGDEEEADPKDKKSKKDKKAEKKKKEEDVERPIKVRHALQVYEQDFELEYPRNHPVPIDQTPKNVFRRRFCKQLAEHLGNQFYPVRTLNLI